MEPSTAHQHAALAHFKSQLSAARLQLPVDSVCLQFLVAREWRPEAAAELWRHNCAWRRSIGATDPPISPHPLEPPEASTHLCGVHGVDNEGRPVYFDQIGRAAGLQVGTELGGRSVSML